MISEAEVPNGAIRAPIGVSCGGSGLDRGLHSKLPSNAAAAVDSEFTYGVICRAAVIPWYRLRQVQRDRPEFRNVRRLTLLGSHS